MKKHIHMCIYIYIYLFIYKDSSRAHNKVPMSTLNMALLSTILAVADAKARIVSDAQRMAPLRHRTPLFSEHAAGGALHHGFVEGSPPKRTEIQKNKNSVAPGIIYIYIYIHNHRVPRLRPRVLVILVLALLGKELPSPSSAPVREAASSLRREPAASGTGTPNCDGVTWVLPTRTTQVCKRRTFWTICRDVTQHFTSCWGSGTTGDCLVQTLQMSTCLVLDVVAPDLALDS